MKVQGTAHGGFADCWGTCRCPAHCSAPEVWMRHVLRGFRGTSGNTHRRGIRNPPPVHFVQFSGGNVRTQTISKRAEFTFQEVLRATGAPPPPLGKRKLWEMSPSEVSPGEKMPAPPPPPDALEGVGVTPPPPRAPSLRPALSP